MNEYLPNQLLEEELTAANAELLIASNQLNEANERYQRAIIGRLAIIAKIRGEEL